MENPPPISPTDEANSFKDYLVALYQSYKEGREFFDIGDICYNWGKKIGIIAPDNNTVSKAMEYAQKKLKETKQEDKRYNPINLSMSGDDEQKKKKFARAYVLTLMFDNNTLGELIQKIHPSQFEKK